MHNKNEPLLHHTVSQFLLRQFSYDPSTRRSKNLRVLRLDKKTGEYSTRGVKGESAINGYNNLTPAAGLPKLFVETKLGEIEDRAAPVVKWLASGGAPDPRQRFHIATFIWVQWLRT